MINRRSILSLSVAIQCGLVTAYAQNFRPIVLPPASPAATETLRFNVMGSNAAFPGWSSVSTCQVSTVFYGADGFAIGDPINFTVGDTAQIFSADVPYALMGAAVSPASVSAQVTLTTLGQGPFSTGTPPIPPCAVAFSLETFDASTGVTHLLLPGQAVQDTSTVAALGAVSIPPCPDGAVLCEFRLVFGRPPGEVIVVPPVGLARTETAQIDVTSSAAGYVGSSAASCDGIVTFYGADGSALGAPATFTLGTTAQVFSAQLPYASTGAAGSRVPISAKITLTPEGVTSFYPASEVPPCIVAFSLKTFDTATGVTHAYVTGQSGPPDATGAASGRASSGPVRRDRR